MSTRGEVESLYWCILDWFEKKKGPLPIKPELRVFPDLKAYSDFVKPKPGAELTDGICIVSLSGIIIGLNASAFEAARELTKAYMILHELEHAREATANGVLTINVIEPAAKTREREIRVSLEVFELAQEFTGQKMPPVVQEYAKRRFEVEL